MEIQDDLDVVFVDEIGSTNGIPINSIVFSEKLITLSNEEFEIAEDD